MRLLTTGGTGVLGRGLRPLAEAAGHEFAMPAREELDRFDPAAVANAVHGVDGVLHLATRIRSLEQVADPDAWRENDRLRADASRILVDAAITPGATVYVQPTVTFVYPPDGPVSEDTPVREVLPILQAMAWLRRISRSSGGTASAASTSAQRMPSTAAATNRTAIPHRHRRRRDRDGVALMVPRIGLALARPIARPVARAQARHR
jgi:NAD dependent epimerase/dehydratase family